MRVLADAAERVRVKLCLLGSLRHERKFGHLEIQARISERRFHASSTDCSHTSKCNLKLCRLFVFIISVPFHLHWVSFHAHGLASTFTAPELFFFFRQLHFSVSTFCLYLSPFYFTFRPPVLVKSNPAISSKPELDAHNSTPFVSQACLEALCTCHT